MSMAAAIVSILAAGLRVTAVGGASLTEKGGVRGQVPCAGILLSMILMCYAFHVIFYLLEPLERNKK